MLELFLKIIIIKEIVIIYVIWLKIKQKLLYNLNYAKLHD